MHGKDLGFKKEQILFLPMKGENLQKNYTSFKNELLRYPGVSSVSVGYGFPGDAFGDGMMTVKEKPGLAPTKSTQLMVDEDYIKTLGLTLLAGRDFAKEIGSDVSAYIINETAVKEFGFRYTAGGNRKNTFLAHLEKSGLFKNRASYWCG